MRDTHTHTQNVTIYIYEDLLDVGSPTSMEAPLSVVYPRGEERIYIYICMYVRIYTYEDLLHVQHANVDEGALLGVVYLERETNMCIYIYIYIYI